MWGLSTIPACLPASIPPHEELTIWNHKPPINSFSISCLGHGVLAHQFKVTRTIIYPNHRVSFLNVQVLCAHPPLSSGHPKHRPSELSTTVYKGEKSLDSIVLIFDYYTLGLKKKKQLLVPAISRENLTFTGIQHARSNNIVTYFIRSKSVHVEYILVSPISTSQ